MKSTFRSGLSYIIPYNLEYWTSTRDQLQNRHNAKKGRMIHSQRTMKEATTTKASRFNKIRCHLAYDSHEFKQTHHLAASNMKIHSLRFSFPIGQNLGKKIFTYLIMVGCGWFWRYWQKEQHANWMCVFFRGKWPCDLSVTLTNAWAFLGASKTEQLIGRYAISIADQ